ncbi:hypothetical protein MXEN_08737 [Mycobacterium xenopi RIVM700367]|nr:hypothetical protein MXEN_08737 [Mycobacterium xenopi RIVM700367]
MTGELVSQSHRRTDDPHWRSILADWLPLSEPGNWALAFAGGVAFALGGWQLNTWRWPQHRYEH